ncbi:PLP-dependent transferase [Epithele typhae]|uniref:PLP-dependent transferase n=1 Tax=Epithele typhae TaxID=378194 RepID=UPI002008D79F|nr:PLP-dependent transferase [Epithele typhae]KAH9944964.1 PLP-dependent transferase [Epithele typhae]
MATTNGTAPWTGEQPTAILHRTPVRPPVATAATGIYVTLEDGSTIIDAVGGAAVACIGNGHPAVLKAMKDQIDQMCYIYNFQLTSVPAEELAQHIIKASDSAFELVGFVSGGSEAMEGVIKTARQYYFELGQTQRIKFIARKLSFHGNTVATLALAHHPTRRVPYAPLLDSDNYHHVSPAYAARFQTKGESEEEYVARLAKELDDKFQELGPDTVIGFVCETVVGATTGVVPPPKGYLKAMKDICDKYGALFMLDEVMSGMGRLGTLHAWQTHGDDARPDIQAVAKGLGGGYVSIGAVLVSPRVAAPLVAAGGWKHGHTYQAHPIACAAALAVQRTVVDEDLLARVRTWGPRMGARLEAALRGPNARAAPFTHDVRGAGAWWGVEFDFENDAARAKGYEGKAFAMDVQARALENGLIIMGFTGGASLDGAMGNHCMLSPAYNVTEEEIERIVDLFVKSVEEVLAANGL